MATNSVPATHNGGPRSITGVEVYNPSATVAEVGPNRSVINESDLPIKKRIQLMADDAMFRALITCDVCNRTFASPRSVAIHKGHHIREGRARLQEGVEGSSTQRVTGNRRPVVQRRRSNGPGVVHECRRCGRSFVSGQALGAHKRHCAWPPVEQEIVNNFDLNELPPPEEEDSLVLPWNYRLS